MVEEEAVSNVVAVSGIVCNSTMCRLSHRDRTNLWQECLTQMKPHLVYKSLVTPVVHTTPGLQEPSYSSGTYNTWFTRA